MSFDYPEIERLNELWVKYKVSTKTDRNAVLGGDKFYPKVNFSLGGESFYLYVDDEYDDLRSNYPLLNFCLVLRELEGFAFSPEYKVWCQERFFDPENEQVYAAFNHLENVYKEVKTLMGEINSQVTDFDFEMNAGAAQALRRSN